MSKLIKPYYLFLDDERHPKQVKWVDLPPVNWTIVRNYDEFVKTITENGLPEIVTFDHDLAYEHYPIAEPNGGIDKPRTIPYESYKEKTGYHCAVWLVNYCVEHKLKLPQYFIHTLNVVGKQNIYRLFHSFNNFINNSIV